MSFLPIDQAFINQFIEADFGLPIAHENAPYDPLPGTAYAELICINNDFTPYSLSDSLETEGIFRVILRYPIGGYSITAKTMADLILAAFPINSLVEYGTSKSKVIKHQRNTGAPEEGWYKIVVSITHKTFRRS
jgi:hypothetical protein